MDQKQGKEKILKYKLCSGHFDIVNKPKLCSNMEMDWRVELDWDWKVSTWPESKQNLDVLVYLYYGVVRQLCGRIGQDNIQSSLSIRLLK